MIRSSALRLLAVAAAAALTPALAGCEAGVNAQTTRPFAPTDGATAVFGSIAIRDAFVLGPPPGGTLLPGQSAGLFLALINSGAPDQLVAVSAPGTAASVTIADRVVPLAHSQAALLTGPVPQLVLDRLSTPLTGGETVAVTLTFAVAGSVTLNIPVVARADYYTTFSPPPTPAAATAKPATGKPRPRASASPPRATPTP